MRVWQPRLSLPGAAAAATLLILIVVTLSASLLGGKVFGSADNILVWSPFSAERPAGWVQPSNPILTDPIQGFLPDLLQTRHDLGAGVAPTWNPEVAGGRPLLASQVHAPVFPLTWLAFLLPFWTSLAWIAAAKLLLAALGVYLFCRELCLARGPSLLASCAFAFGSFFIVWLEHPQTNVWLCLPWMFLAAHRVCARASLPATGLLGLATGLAWLGGHPESVALQIAAVAAYALFELLRERPERSVARGGLVAGGLVVGGGIGAIVNLPLLELLGQAAPTNRGGPGLPLSAGWSFVFPELWGNPAKRFSGLGPINFNERTGYIGALPLLLAIAGLGRRRPARQWFFAALVLVSLAITFDTPLIATGVRDLPGGQVIRLTRLLIIASFGGAVLAGYGLDRWLRAPAAERRSMLLVMSGCALLPALAWLARHTDTLSHLPAALAQLPATHPSETSQPVVELGSVWRWVLICGLGIGGLALVSRRRWQPIAAVAVIVALTGIDLVALDRGYHGAVPRSEADPPAPASLQLLARSQGAARMVGLDFAMSPNTGELYGIRDARVAIDIPFPQRYNDLWGGMGGTVGDQDFFLAGNPDAHRLADVFAVRHVLLSPGASLPPWLHPVQVTAGGTVAVNPTALPRAWVAYDWRPARDRSAALAATLASSSASLERQPVIEQAGPPPAAGPAAPPAAANVTDVNSTEVRVTATASRSGYLVLDDSAFPGWDASLDGRPTRWLPANENFRAVAIPAGRHTVTFSYRPASVTIGTIITVLSLLAALALALAGRRSRRASADPVPASSQHSFILDPR